MNPQNNSVRRNQKHPEMEEKEELNHLYQLYLNDQCSAAQLERFFMLIGKNENDTEILELLSNTWDNTTALPETGLVPDFLPKINTLKPARSHWMSYSLQQFAAVAAILLLVTCIYLYRTDLMSFVAPVHQLQTVSASAEHKQFQLSDGTRIWLSPNSTLTYPEKFNDKQRIVSLDGEAFFDVAQHASQPFLIKSGKVSTRVLGTSFNISAYPQQPDINITLVTGKVAVALKTSNETTETIMTANQRVTINKIQEKIIKTDFPDAGTFLNKRVGLFDYKGTPFSEVLKDLELQYNIRISSIPEMDKSIFYGRLDMTAPITQTLNKLSTVMEINWKRDGGQYVITK